METNKFIFPVSTRCVLSAPSGGGKTVFTRKVIDNCQTLFTHPPRRIIYTYKYPQVWFECYSDRVQFSKEVPSDLDGSYHSLVILDDLMCERQALEEAVSLFVRGSHHLNCSIFFLTQNLFASSPHFRTISLNATHFVLFKTIRGYHQIEHFGRQIFGPSTKEFMSAYKDATREAFNYLVVDLTPEQDYRLRSKIFPDESEIVYTIE